MASDNAKAVAHDVLENIRNGTKISKRQIIKNRGYAQSIADHPDRVTKTQSYKSIIDPVVDKLKKERESAIKRLTKTRNKAKYRDLIDGIDKLTKNIQLLSGESTENVSVRTVSIQIRR